MDVRSEKAKKLIRRWSAVLYATAVLLAFVAFVTSADAGSTSLLSVEKDTLTTNHSSLGYSCEGPVVNNEDTVVISSKTKIKIFFSQTDRAYSIAYSVNNDVTESYHRPISINEEGKYIIYCSASTQNGDTLKNSFLVKVDNHGPAIRAEFDFNHIVISKHKCEEGKITESTVLPHGTSLTVSASDQTGVKAIFYSVDKAYERRYVAPVRLTAKGNHTVKFRAIDLVGNETISEGINFIVVE